MSHTPGGAGSDRRRHKTSHDESLHMTLGRSFNAGAQQQQRSNQHGAVAEPGSVATSPLPAPQFISKLPAAVANVQEDVKSYVHNKRVTSYQIGSTLGEGSFAKVKEGFHVLVGEKVAVKVIDKKKAEQDPYVAKNFRREAKLLQMVHHPNILQLLEVVETDNSYYLITELCSGGELMNHIYKEKQLTENETRKYMRQMVSAVDHLHKAGIIHRDLKVENLLLDSSGNVKIIDFGLSNEEYVMEDSRRVHCSTQCGSPAYAAPELLGHKSYGPEVDIWSLGVNMYAMLTGCLPYTVEPFNITALHAKMLENKMNPIPSSLSPECNNLLCGLLISDPALRLKMPDIIAHPWMMANGSSALKPHPFPNKLTANDINEDIVEHMVHVLKLKDKEEDVTAELLADRACAISAVYHLMLARLDRYIKQKSKVKLRNKSRYDPHMSRITSVDDDDTHSTMSYATRPSVRDHNPNRVHLRPVTRDGQAAGENSRLRQRRKTLPSELMKDDVEKIRQRYNILPPVTHQTSSRYPAGTLPRTLRNRPDTTLQPCRGGQDMTSVARPTSHLNPVRPQPSFPTSLSQPKDLNEMTTHRPEVNRHTWNPPHNASLVGSRPVSRQPVSSRQTSQTSFSHRWSGSEYDLEFYEVESSQGLTSKHSYAQKKVTSNTGRKDIHFPSITAHCSRDVDHKRSYSYGSKDVPLNRPLHRKNGHWSPKQYEFETDHTASYIISELQRGVERLNISCIDQKGNTVYLKCQSMRFQVHVDKDHDICQLDFQWLHGGSREQYKDLCLRIFRSLSV